MALIRLVEPGLNYPPRLKNLILALKNDGRIFSSAFYDTYNGPNQVEYRNLCTICGEQKYNGDRAYFDCEENDCRTIWLNLFGSREWHKCIEEINRQCDGDLGRVSPYFENMDNNLDSYYREHRTLRGFEWL